MPKTARCGAAVGRDVAFPGFPVQAPAYACVMAYVLHYAPDNASLIIRLALDMGGLSYDTILVDRRINEQASAHYRVLNPQGQIPALQTPSGTMFETGAILAYLTETHAGLGPQPGDPLRARFLSWLFVLSNTLHPALRQSFYPDRFVPPEHSTALRVGLRSEIARVLGLLEAEARVADVIGAERLTVLDLYLGGCLRWAQLYPLDAPVLAGLQGYPALSALLTRLDALSATALAIRAEGLGPTPFTAPQAPNPPEGSAT